MTEPADDVELLRRSAAGDRAAFGSFMDRHAGPVHRFLLSLQANSHDAEDALQECFVAAWRGAGGFDGRASARTWLFTIARNALRRQFRRRAGEPAVHESLETLGLAAGWGSTTDAASRFEAKQLLEWSLAHLPDEERDVIILRDVHGFSGEEAAQMLDLTVSAMKSRLHRGRLRLMGVLAREEGRDV